MHGFREEDFLSFSHYKSMGANDPGGVAPSGAVWSTSILSAYAIMSETLVFKILWHLP